MSAALSERRNEPDQRCAFRPAFTRSYEPHVQATLAQSIGGVTIRIATAPAVCATAATGRGERSQCRRVSRQILGLMDEWILCLDIVTLAVRPGEERVGLIVADDHTLGRIPVEFPPQTHRDVR